MIRPLFAIAIPLFSAHVIGDFIIQTDEDVDREGRFLALLKHIIWIGVISYILVGIINAWHIVLVIVISHAVIDYVKLRLQRTDLKAFVYDQTAHFVVITLLSYCIAANNFYPQSNIWFEYFGRAFYALQVFAIGAVICIYVGGIFVGLGVQPFLIQMAQEDAGLQEEGSDLSAIHARGLKDGGKFIGYLERALIYIFVLVNQPSAIGFLIAAKSVFRFGELREGKNRMEAEYIIIGTLLSFLVGIAVSFLIKKILLLI